MNRRAPDMSGASPPLRCGIICDGTTFPAWQARCVRQLLGVAGVEVVLLIVGDRHQRISNRSRRLRKLLGIHHFLWTLFFDLYVSRRSRAARPVELAAALARVPILHCPGAQGGRFRGDELVTVRNYDLDFILSLAVVPPLGGILDMPRHGVWAFHHLRQGRDNSLACFWEIYRGDAVTGATLRRIADNNQDDVALYQGYFKTLSHSFVCSRDTVLFAVADWPARVCAEIRAGRIPRGELPPLPLGAGHPPTNPQVLRFLLGLAGRSLVIGSDALLRADVWNIGIIDAPIHALLATDGKLPVRWLPKAPAGQFVADPFVGNLEGNTTIFVEAFDYSVGKGHIAALRVRPDGTLSSPESVIATPWHLSYPYVLTYRGEMYCIPESAAAREVAIYQATTFPSGWRRCAILIDSFAATDATIFEHEGRWWLLCGRADGQGDLCSALYAWYAADLFGPWTPHPSNPLKIDVRSSRPAGTPFVWGGHLYRPAQDCSHGYGGAVTINRVLSLTPTEFAEEVVATVLPDRAGRYPDGLHTLSAFGQRTLVDGKRRCFIPLALHARLHGFPGHAIFGLGQASTLRNTTGGS